MKKDFYIVSSNNPLQIPHAVKMTMTACNDLDQFVADVFACNASEVFVFDYFDNAHFKALYQLALSSKTKAFQIQEDYYEISIHNPKKFTYFTNQNKQKKVKATEARLTIIFNNSSSRTVNLNILPIEYAQPGVVLSRDEPLYLAALSKFYRRFINRNALLYSFQHMGLVEDIGGTFLILKNMQAGDNRRCEKVMLAHIWENARLLHEYISQKTPNVPRPASSTTNITQQLGAATVTEEKKTEAETKQIERTKPVNIAKKHFKVKPTPQTYKRPHRFPCWPLRGAAKTADTTQPTQHGNHVTASQRKIH